MEFTTITNAASDYGITGAREAYNASLPATVPDPENPDVQIPNPARCADNYEYMDFVLTGAIDSWCKMYPVAPTPLPAPLPPTPVEVVVSPVSPVSPVVTTKKPK